MLSAGEEQVVNEGKLWKGGFNFKYSMYGARQACYFTKKNIFVSTWQLRNSWFQKCCSASNEWMHGSGQQTCLGSNINFYYIYYQQNVLTLLTLSHSKYAATWKWFVIFSSWHGSVQKDMLLELIFSIWMTPKYKKKPQTNHSNNQPIKKPCKMKPQLARTWKIALLEKKTHPFFPCK